jgi:dienelactone hydrolase
VTFILYPKMGHAFCNEEDPLGSFDEPNAREAWARTVDFLHEHLD